MISPVSSVVLHQTSTTCLSGGGADGLARPILGDVVHAIFFYILRTGCQWRYLPKQFPPKSTVWWYFNQWGDNPTLESIHDLLRRKVRAAEKPYSTRTSASVDSQSVDTTSGGEQRGRDNAKNVDGRKRHIVVGQHGLTDGRPVNIRLTRGFES